MVHSRDDLRSKFQVIRTKGSQVIAVGSWAEKSGNFVDSPCTSLSRMPKSANRKRSRDHVACRSRDHGNPINRIFFLMLNFLSKEFYKIHDKTTFHVATYIVSDYHIILLKYFSYDAEKIHFI